MRYNRSKELGLSVVALVIGIVLVASGQPLGWIAVVFAACHFILNL